MRQAQPAAGAHPRAGAAFQAAHAAPLGLLRMLLSKDIILPRPHHPRSRSSSRRRSRNRRRSSSRPHIHPRK